MTLFTFDPIFESPLLLVVLSAALLVIPWIVPVAGRTVTSSQRKTLQWLRTGTALLLLLAVFRPAIVRTDSMPTEATIAVLLDRSRSMGLPADETHSRSKVQNELVQKLLLAINKFDDSLSLKTLVYAAEAKELTVDQKMASELDQPPSGNATDIARALAAAVQSSAGRPLAGVVLIGDGVEVLPPENRDGVKTRDPQAGARLLASLDVPLWTVAVGPPGDLNQVRDVEIAELPESFGLFAGNEAVVPFAVRTRALTNKSFDVRVVMTPEGSNAASNEIATRTITPSTADEAIPMSIPIIAPKPGHYRMEVRVDPQAGETLLSNNSQVAFVDVRDGGGRVLYVEGQPRPEQSFLLRSLRRFQDLQVTYRWIASDTKDPWPIDLGLADPSNRFDVIIIGDLPAEAIGNKQLSAIASRVNEGAALLMIGGLNTFANGAYDKSTLASVLPVKLDRTQRDKTGDIRLTVPHPHPITNLNPAGDAASQTETWKSLPALVGANTFADVRVAPGIDVLLETAEGDPLLVVGEFGGGRVATFAGDSTWRWWRQGKSAEHRRFWRQLVLWLLNRDADADEAIDITLAKRRAELGQSIDYIVSYPTSTLPVKQTASLSIIASDGKTTEIQSDVMTLNEVDKKTKLEGKLTGLVPGMYRLRAAIPGSDNTTAERTFQILDQEAELRQPFADHSYMKQLAEQTAAAGGAMFLPDDINELLNLIAQLRRKSQAPVVQKYRLGDSSYSAWPLFVSLASLLGVEWYLRRRWGLA